MQTQFTEKELGDCLELVIDHRGKTPKKLDADWIDTGIPTISAKNVNGGRLVSRDSIRHVSFEVYKRWMKEDVKRGDCFLVSEGATLGECMLWDYDHPIVLGQRIFCLRANPAILNPRFLYAYMTSRSFQDEIIGRATGTSVDGLRQTEVLKLKLRLPPIEQQELIGDILYNLDHKIELNRRMNATLETMARALFQSWFVDFDPVRAKLDGRQPTGLAPATAALFPNEFEDSELGEIPMGWQVGSLGDLVALRADRVDATAAKNNTRYIALEDMPSKSIDLSGFQLGSAVNSSIIAFRKGDILFGSMRPYFHKVGLTFFDGITRTTTFVLRPRSDCFRHFALLHFFSDDVVAYSTTASVGTTIPYVKWDSLGSYRIPIPPDSLLETFEKTVSTLVERIAVQGEESHTLATLRDTLLPKLLSGEIRPMNVRNNQTR